MNKKKIIVTLAAAISIILVVLYVMSQMGGRAGMGAGPKGGKGPRNASHENAMVQVADKNKGNQAVAPDTASQMRTPRQEPSALKGEGAGGERQGNRSAKSGAPTDDDSIDIAEVGVVKVFPATYNATVKGYGQASATHVLTLSAQVSGQITSLSPRFETGALLNKGEVMAFVDETDYQQALAAAEATYEAAYVALEEERLQGVQAQDEWTRSGLTGEPESALVLRAPQLKSAQAALREAEQNVLAAKRDLAFSKISTPFNALVVGRSVQPGSYVQVGTEIANLYSADLAEISIPLSPSQWAQLPDITTGEAPGWKVTLTDTMGENHWSATIERVELHQDEETRQRRAVAVVERPLTLNHPLYFGTFLVAEIEGRAIENVWKVPSSAISQKQEVWFVDAQTNLLKKFTPEVYFEYEGFAYIAPINEIKQALIVARPLNNYLINTRVKPVIEGAGNE